VIREVLSPLTLLEGEKQEIRMPITLLFSIGKQLFLIYNQLEQGGRRKSLPGSSNFTNEIFCVHIDLLSTNNYQINQKNSI